MEILYKHATSLSTLSVYQHIHIFYSILLDFIKSLQFLLTCYCVVFYFFSLFFYILLSVLFFFFLFNTLHCTVDSLLIYIWQIKLKTETGDMDKSQQREKSIRPNHLQEQPYTRCRRFVFVVKCWFMLNFFQLHVW